MFSEELIDLMADFFSTDHCSRYCSIRCKSNTRWCYIFLYVKLIYIHLKMNLSSDVMCGASICSRSLYSCVLLLSRLNFHFTFSPFRFPPSLSIWKPIQIKPVICLQFSRIHHHPRADLVLAKLIRRNIGQKLGVQSIDRMWIFRINGTQIRNIKHLEHFFKC